MKKAFVTAFQTPDFLPGIVALKNSLRLFGNTVELVIMASRSIPADQISALACAGCKIRFVEPLRNPHLKTEQDFNYYTKMRIFELIEFDKLIYLDADLLICAEIEQIFSKPALSAVVAGGLIAGEKWMDLNSGFMVIEPSLELFAGIDAAIDYLPSKDGADQGFLHSYFPDWPHSPALHLDHTYNVPAPFLDAYCAQFGFEFSYSKQMLNTNVAVLHFWGPAKPWHISPKAGFLRGMPKLAQAIELWWDLYAADPLT